MEPKHKIFFTVFGLIIAGFLITAAVFKFSDAKAGQCDSPAAIAEQLAEDDSDFGETLLLTGAKAVEFTQATHPEVPAYLVATFRHVLLAKPKDATVKAVRAFFFENDCLHHFDNIAGEDMPRPKGTSL